MMFPVRTDYEQNLDKEDHPSLAVVNVNTSSQGCGAGAGAGAAETVCSEPEPSKTGRFRLRKGVQLWQEKTKRKRNNKKQPNKQFA